MSMDGAAASPREMPISASLPSSSYFLAAVMRALEGMQPTLRQTPPQYCFSMLSVFTPSWPSRMAQG